MHLMPRTRPPYPPEFRREAVQLVLGGRTDPRGHTQTGTYNTLNQLESWTDALGRTTTYAHDPVGDLTSITDPEGHTTTYSYNPLNQLSSVSFGVMGGGSPTSTINYGYDAAGDLASAEDSRAGTWTRSYDAYHRLIGESGPDGSVDYAYNAVGKRLSMSIGGEEIATYSYNSDDQLTGISSPEGNVSFAYNHNGEKGQTILPNGDSENYSYSAASQLSGITYRNPSGEEFGNLQYDRDALGRLTTLSGSYARTSLPEALSEATYDADNELTSLEGHTYSYDSDGNLTSNGSSTYTWNDRNQLTDITQGTKTWDYAYDPFGRRIDKTANGVETKYLYDGANVARESSEGDTDQLLNGPGLDERFARTTSAGTSSYLTEELGSTLALANTSGTPTTEYTYGPFGGATSSGAPSTNPYQYAGRESEENGLQYNRARYYEPGMGRFISEDPLGMVGSGINLYRYVGDSPINAIDPRGLEEYNSLETVPGGECKAEKKLYEGTGEEGPESCSPAEIPESVEKGLCEAGTTLVPLPGGTVTKIIGGKVLQGVCEEIFPPEKKRGGGSGLGNPK
jgi:RHS repeat-associated protein